MHIEVMLKMKKQVEFIKELLNDNEVVVAKAVLEIIVKEIDKDVAEYEQSMQE